MNRSVLNVVASGGIGDTILLTPCLRQWKREFPSGRLVVHCSEDLHRDVLLYNPRIDSLRVIETEGEHAASLWKPRRRRARYFVPIAYAKLLPSITYRISASRIMAEMLGLRLESDQPEIFLTPAEFSAAENRLIAVKDPIAIHACGAFTENKSWFTDNWEAVIRGFPERNFIQLGASTDPAVPGTIDHRGLALRDSFATLHACKALICVDSALSHAAAALKVPSVVLFGPSTPVVWGHARAKNLYAGVRCSPCIDVLRFGRCPYDRECMKALTPALVREALRTQLGGTTTS